MDFSASLEEVIGVSALCFAAPSSVSPAQILAFNTIYDQFREAQISEDPKKGDHARTSNRTSRSAYHVSLTGHSPSFSSSSFVESRQHFGETYPISFLSPASGQASSTFPFPSEPTLPDANSIDAFVHASEIVYKTLPAYGGLFASQICSLVFLKPRSGMTESGSSPNHPNLIYASSQQSAGFYAETIIHEGSHQILQFLETTCSLVQPKGQTYYNPILKRDRPIRGILAAYHAFGLVAATARYLVPHLSFSEGIELAAKAERFKQGIGALDTHLQSSEELTENGKSLFHVIRSEINTHLQ